MKTNYAKIRGNNITVGEELEEWSPLWDDTILEDVELTFLPNGQLKIEGNEIECVYETRRTKVSKLDYEPHPSEVFYTTKKWWRKGGVPYVNRGWVMKKETHHKCMLFSSFKLTEK